MPPIYSGSTPVTKMYLGGTQLSAVYLGVQSLLSGGIPINWRLPITHAYDSDANTALTTALVGSETTKSRPNYTVGAGLTRTVAVKVAAISAPGGMLSYVGMTNGFTVASAESFDSTNGVDGTWSAISSTQIFPAGGDSTTGVMCKRQPIRLAVGPMRWVRLAITSTGASVDVKSIMAHQLQSGDQDAWLVVGPSLEAFGMRSVDLEAEVLAQFPLRDPVCFLYGVGGAVSYTIDDWPAITEATFGDIYKRVIVGNVIGNDISSARPIADDSPASIADIRSRYDTILNGFGSKPVYGCRITYRAYSGVTPDLPSDGSLPYSEQIVYPSINAHGFGFDAVAGMPRVDMYAPAMLNRALLSDAVHFGTVDGTNYGWMRAEWVKTAFSHAYTGAWGLSFVERLVVLAEASTQKTEAQYAVNSLPTSAFRTSLQTRLDNIEPVTPAGDFAVGDVVAYSFGTAGKTIDANTNGVRGDPLTIPVNTVLVSNSVKKSGANSSVPLTLIREFVGVSASGNGSLSSPPDITTNMSSGSWFTGELSGVIKDDSAVALSNLPSGNYSIVVAGSRSVTEDGLRSVTVSVDVGSGGGGPLTYSAANPASGTLTPSVTLTNVTPLGGVIQLSFNRPDKTNATKYGYVSAIVITRVA